MPTDAADAELKLLARRVFIVSAKDHNNLEVPLKLSPKQYVKIKIFDPDDNKLNSPYIRLRNEAYEEYKNLNYTKARQLFQQAALMSDSNQEEAMENLNLVDSVIYYRDKAEAAYNKAEFLDAYNYYARVAALNSNDNYAATRRQESNNQYKSNCDIAYTKAEYLFNEKRYEEAKAQYQIMLDERCSQNIPLYSNVESRIQLIDEIIKSKTNHSTVITYEWAKDTPFGFQVGKYKDHKWGGFFQMDVNKDLIKAVQSSGDPKEKFGTKPEADISFGWTVKLIKPVWLFFGPGATAKLYYGDFKDNQYPGKNYSADSKEDKEKLVSLEEEFDKINIAVAVSPVIGLTLKYSYFAIRASYQYRFSMKKELEDYLGQHRFSFGVGFAF